MIKQSHQGFGEALLFVLNTFLIFLLVFGDHVVVPHWLQPVGRMHPLLLHFPIVLLIMAMLFEFFRFRAAFKEEILYQNFTTALLLIGSLLAAITAIMGLFLSKEPGYSGNTLQWHKWAGSGVVLLSSAIYWCRNSQWYKASLAKTGAIITFIALVLAGHYGAYITHGENFILAPVMSKAAPIPIDKALVYKDVIQPIFENKCANCHNEDKLKGGLMLTDSASILKGGKTGKLFIPGDPQMSLILQRIHLPLNDDKHMPPAGKTQLTDDELNLLYLWIKEKPNFKQKVLSLPAADSLRLLASTVLAPATSAGDTYDFTAADEKTIAGLNNNYRVVHALAKESPALAVNIYNKNIYTPKVLEDLSPIKKQLVSLNLNKMPVKDQELKTIARFENLRNLDLNFTALTGSGLKYLTQLKHLRSLSLVGTRLNFRDVRQVVTMKSLAELFIWNTGITNQEIQQLRKLNKNVAFDEGFKDDGKPIKLNVPQFKNTEAVFSKPFELLINHPIKDVVLRYTTDGSDPDSIKSPVYKPGIIINSDAIIKVRAYKMGWYGSDIVTASYNKSSYTPDSVSFENGPAGADPKLLIDKTLGSFNFRDGKWVAAQKDLVINLTFTKPINLHTIGLNSLRVVSQQILVPAEVTVLDVSVKNKFKVVGRVKPAPPAKQQDADTKKVIECKITAVQPLTYIQIRIKPVMRPPSWFPPQKPVSIFMDELFFN
ncbi:c-type cytochrome domain-containing protein [Mucilaginibacter panaciglaebae]|uniref:Chitobiase/beta-hexosaminidase C-terminal domain-containing protein n=1 Tax=Mucilaginibacter panaciglaebae TaxID=502331 RepID=A0ABP7WA76_9SPHI